MPFKAVDAVILVGLLGGSALGVSQIQTPGTALNKLFYPNGGPNHNGTPAPGGTAAPTGADACAGYNRQLNTSEVQKTGFHGTLRQLYEATWKDASKAFAQWHSDGGQC